MSYVEPAALTPEAQAIVLLVEHSGDPITGTIVESQVMPNPGQVPIDFELAYATAEIDPGALYTVSAAIVDGMRLWVTDGGTRVITQGNPTTGIDLDLVYQADLLKGQVTGTISGVGVTLSGSGFAAAVLFDSTSEEPVGVTVEPAPIGVPIEFGVPFDPAEIDEASDYVVVAAIVEGDNRWSNTTGVPVITKGNPLSDVTVPVSAVSPTPSPSPSPEDSGGIGALGVILLLLIVGAIIAGAVWYMRSRQNPPPDGEGGPGEAAGGAGAEPPLEPDDQPATDTAAPPGEEPPKPSP